MLAIYLLALFLSEGNSAVIDIPDDIGDLCPYSNICNHSATMKTAYLNKVRQEPCCHECSCEKSCGLRLNCCFEEDDTYKLVERGLAACIEPLQGNAALVNMHSSFYMIQACFDNETNPYRLCRTRDELGSSLIAPVSSAKTGYIYVNDECALCNGLVSTKAWDPIFINNPYLRSTFFLLDLKDSLLKNISTLLYEPPDDETSWHKMECFKHSLNHSDLNPSCENRELNDLCVYLNAPYTDMLQTVCKNVYCTRCQNVNQPIEVHCDRKFSFSGSLTMLIDAEVFTNLKQNSNRESSPALTCEECVNGFGTTGQV